MNININNNYKLKSVKYEDNEVERVGGINYTIKDGIVYNSKLLLEDVKRMVKKRKDELNYEIYQPGQKINLTSKKGEIID